MKSILNSLLTMCLCFSPSSAIVASSIKQNKLNNNNYQDVTENYVINPKNNLKFYKWLNPPTKDDESWDYYFKTKFKTINKSNDKLNNNVTPLLEAGGGVYLNLLSVNKPLSPQGHKILQHSQKIFGSYTYRKIITSPNFIYQPFVDHYPKGRAGIGKSGTPFPCEWNWNLHYDQGDNILTQNKKVNGAIKFIQGFLTTEINYWYYKHFSLELSSSVPDFQLKMQEYSNIHQFYLNNFNRLIRFEFGVKYNSEIKKIISYNAPGAFKTGYDLASFFTELIPGWGELLGFLHSFLSAYFDEALIHYQSVDNKFRFISNAWTLDDIDAIMNSILGNGSPTFPAKSVIKDFIKKNGKYPDSLTLKNFSYGVNKFTASAHEQETGQWVSQYNRDSDNYTWEESYSSYQTTPQGWNIINLSNLEPFLKFSISAHKTAPNYKNEQLALEDQTKASKESPINIYTPAKSGKILASDWDGDQITNTLNETWKVLGGLDQDLYPDVSYKHVNITRGKMVLCEMYLPLLGFTKEHPRYFYIKGI